MQKSHTSRRRSPEKSERVQSNYPKKSERRERKSPQKDRRESRFTSAPTIVPRPSAGIGAKSGSRRKSVNGRRETYDDLQKRTHGQELDGYDDFQGESKRSKNWVLCVVTLVLFLGGAAGALIYLWPLIFGNECNSLQLPPEYKAIVCSRLRIGKACEFNVAVCEIPCPVGLESDEYACIISCSCATHGLFESDVSYDENNLNTLLAAYMTVEDHDFELYSGSASSILNIWNKKRVAGSIRVPYVISPGLDPAVIKGINQAVEVLSRKTCVELVVRTNENDYLTFQNGLGCSSVVSRVGGEQHINLSPGCSSLGAVMHEIMHALGFWHEQSRPDRNERVMVKWANIDKSNQHHFNTRSRETIFDFGSPYDVLSVMQGSGYSFSINLLSPSMIDLDTNSPVQSQRERLSEEDAVEINALYECYFSDNRTNQDAHWGEWSEPGQCSMTCGSGIAYTLRECLGKVGDVIPRRHCGTDYYQEEPCEMGPCENGIWGPWSPCDYTCGIGTRRRNSCCGRSATTEVENCKQADCSDPADTFWAGWQEWGECLRTCGNGMRRRYRTCFDVFDTKVEYLRCPQVGTSHLEVEICSADPCPDTDPEVGSWSEWGPWGECSRTCDMGSRKKNRECLTRSGYTARFCLGEDMDIEPCDNNACPVSILSMWTPWGPWSDCSASCDGGLRRRKRFCEAVVPLTLETDCGESMELLDKEDRVETCHNEPCLPDVTQWSEWQSWGECSKNCDGTRWRLRTCIGGKIGDPECKWDDLYDTQKCNEGTCDPAGRSVDPLYTGNRWAAWFQWGECSVTCDGGLKKRYRLCETMERVLSYDCVTEDGGTKGYIADTKECSMQSCLNPTGSWAAWEQWSSCTATCGRGIKRRKRECMTVNRCGGPRFSSEVCVLAVCKVTEERTVKKPNQGIFANNKLSKFFAGGSGGLFEERKWKRKGTFCQATGSRLFAGDFQGDGKADSLCLDMTGKIKIAYDKELGSDAKADWLKQTDFCTNVIGMVFAVDFNGDGSDDLICYEKRTGEYSVIFSREGKFEGKDDKVQGKTPASFCRLYDQIFYAADKNGDGKADLVCRDGVTEDILVNREIVT